MLLAPILVLSIIFWGYKEAKKERRKEYAKRIIEVERMRAEQERAYIYASNADVA